MTNIIKKVVIVGGGTAGWMAAALIKKVMASVVDITLIESEDIGTVGVGEATIPPIQHVNSVLGIDEAEFLRETGATIKLAIRFENWRVQGESYYHTFGNAGQAMPFCQFHDYWLRAKALGDTSSLWDYDLNYLAASQYQFAKMKHNNPALDIPYAYHFDASLYAKFLRTLSERMGVQRIEGEVRHVALNPANGHVHTLHLKSEQTITGDLFIDCSGFKGLLIQQKLNAGFEDWGHWLPCNKAITVPSQRHPRTAPFTRSSAQTAGWQWQIPLQHRNGNGLVYSSAHYSDEQAADLLLANLSPQHASTPKASALDSQILQDPKIIHFKTGRSLKPWYKNVVALGLAGGFVEPLESTSIHMIQSAITRLIKLFPQRGICASEVAEYNRQSKQESEKIRDFIILHYHLNAREDSDFWRDLRTMDIPDSLAQKIALFKETGKITQDPNDLFLESSWLQVMLGQGITPQSYHPLANNLSDSALQTMLNNLKAMKQSPLPQMPDHDTFLSMLCRTE